MCGVNKYWLIVSSLIQARCVKTCRQAKHAAWFPSRCLSLSRRGRFGGGAGWGSWIRTRTDGVRVRCSTVKLIPNRKGFATGVPMAHGDPANRGRKRKPGGAITAQRRYLQAHPVAFGQCFRAVAPPQAPRLPGKAGRAKDRLADWLEDWQANWQVVADHKSALGICELGFE